MTSQMITLVATRTARGLERALPGDGPGAVPAAARGMSSLRRAAVSRRRRATRSPHSLHASRAPRSRTAAMRYRGTGVLASRASHRRPVTPATTVMLALIAGAITLWLGLIAQFGGVVGDNSEIPARLAVVQVQAGESLQGLAQRVAPGAPVGDVIERIRVLNELESVGLTAGQTLIAPVG
ncbi:MAG: LysM peptidoglycan-binding domain-containing protein [Mycolicibacterium sp.]|uniref:LysM peptidoglycan-binding domain-containing protein n=1 Tax=Mycolicibacterium sp. TaxID=2320850 RepID=UPI003D0B29DD